MSITEIVTLVALLVTGGIAAYVIQWVKRADWSSRPKWALSVVISAVFGLATSWLAGDVLGLIDAWGELSGAEVFAWLSATYVTATGFYELWVKPRAID